MKDRLFDKVYESEESKRHLAEFLIGKAPKEIDTANVRPVIFGNKYNDLAFMYDGCMYIMMEEQSTECANIAYRLLEYVVAGLRQQIDSEKILYGTQRVKFPVPKLFAVNVGIFARKRTEPRIESLIKLSDSYMELPDKLREVQPDLELIVHMYDLRMKKEEILEYINRNVLPARFRDYRLEENELLQYAVSTASITYVQRVVSQDEVKSKIRYQAPENISSIADMIELLIARGVLKTLFMRKEVYDMTTATFSREDILRAGMEAELREILEEEIREEGEEYGRNIERRKMSISFYKQGVDEKVIAQAADVEVEELRRWIKEEGLA